MVSRVGSTDGFSSLTAGATQSGNKRFQRRRKMGRMEGNVGTLQRCF